VSNIWRTVFDLAEKENELQTLELKTKLTHFWNDPEVAGKVTQNIHEIKEAVETLETLKKDFVDFKELAEAGAVDEAFFKKLQARVAEQEKTLFLSGKYDKNNAILEIFSGAGGRDAQDFSAMLLRMYEKYCAKKGFHFALLSQSFGEAGGPEGRIGLKYAAFEIRSKYAFGMLKREAGVHRLVRVSPFSAKQLRHTSFALVNVLPDLEESVEDLQIRQEDLRVDTFRASGPGGQYVNKTESAIRITHLPTGIVVACQTERLQGKNKEKAMKILYAKLYQLKEEQHKKELKEIKGKEVLAEFGSQIRSYVLHPYQMAKDLRTQHETSDVEGVLNGDLEAFIAAEVKLKN